MGQAKNSGQALRTAGRGSSASAYGVPFRAGSKTAHLCKVAHLIATDAEPCYHGRAHARMEHNSSSPPPTRIKSEVTLSQSPTYASCCPTCSLPPPHAVVAESTSSEVRVSLVPQHVAMARLFNGVRNRCDSHKRFASNVAHLGARQMNDWLKEHETSTDKLSDDLCGRAG